MRCDRDATPSSIRIKVGSRYPCMCVCNRKSVSQSIVRQQHRRKYPSIPRGSMRASSAQSHPEAGGGASVERTRERVAVAEGGRDQDRDASGNKRAEEYHRRAPKASEKMDRPHPNQSPTHCTLSLSEDSRMARPIALRPKASNCCGVLLGDGSIEPASQNKNTHACGGRAAAAARLARARGGWANENAGRRMTSGQGGGGLSNLIYFPHPFRRRRHRPTRMRARASAERFTSTWASRFPSLISVAPSKARPAVAGQAFFLRRPAYVSPRVSICQLGPGPPVRGAISRPPPGPILAQTHGAAPPCAPCAPRRRVCSLASVGTRAGQG